MKNNEKSKDSLGDRMKGYESVTRTYLMPRGYACIRVDGRSFHTWTCGLERPFDKGLLEDMNATAVYLCENIQNAKVGYVQSDEISVITANADNLETRMFFDGNIQKIASVVASMATAKFNDLRMWRRVHHGLPAGREKENLAMFDCRCWNVPNAIEAYNTLVWRQLDAIRNSISAVSRFHFSHNELHGKTQSDMHEMLHQKGINWTTDFTDGEKNGRIIVKKTFLQPIEGSDSEVKPPEGVIRSHWVAQGAWEFTKDEDKLLKMIPKYE